jgi:hypothetical protein
MEAKKFGQWLELLKITLDHADGHGYMDNSELLCQNLELYKCLYFVFTNFVIKEITFSSPSHKHFRIFWNTHRKHQWIAIGID